MAKKPSPWQPTRLVAVHEITGGTKDAKHVTAANTVIDPAEAEKLGLNDADILKLLSRGAIVEREESLGLADDVKPVPFDGLSADEMRSLLEDHGIEHPQDYGAEELFEAAIAAPSLDAVTSADKAIAEDILAARQRLRNAGLEVDDEDSIDDLVAAALAHGTPGDIDTVAGRIERDMKVDEIRDELGKRQVPFETDANKPALARLLAQVRAADPAPAEGGQDGQQLV